MVSTCSGVVEEMGSAGVSVITALMPSGESETVTELPVTMGLGSSGSEGMFCGMPSLFFYIKMRKIRKIFLFFSKNY